MNQYCASSGSSWSSASGCDHQHDECQEIIKDQHNCGASVLCDNGALPLEAHEDFIQEPSDQWASCEKKPQVHKMPGAIWALSCAFFLMNIASCIVFACAPMVMKSLGVTMKSAATVEGTVEGFALIIRSLSGFISDALGYRKPFICWGYGIMALSRFLLAPSTLVEMIIASRWIEKLGNGLQASPREAFIGDIVHPSMLGRAYGLNKTFGMAGSFLGSFLMLFISLSYGNQHFPLKTFMWLSAFMTFFSFLLLFVFVKEKPQNTYDHKAHGHLNSSEKSSTRAIQEKKSLGAIFKNIQGDIKEFSPIFWKTLIIISLIKFGYCSGTFFIKQLTESQATFFGHSLHGNTALTGGVFLTIQNFACALLSYPLGKISDILDRRLSVSIGFVFMLSALGLFAFDYLLPANMLYLAVILYGLQMSMQGALMALLTSTMPHHLHGTGFGLFFFSSGLSVIFTNNILMGFQNHTTSFMTIAVFVVCAFVLLPIWLNNKNYPLKS